MNEGCGNQIFDLSGNKNTGTITNAVWSPGKFGSCLSFDGDGDYVSTNANYIINSLAGSVSLWLKANEIPVANTCYLTAYENSYNFSRLRMSIDAAGKFDTILAYAGDYPNLIDDGQVVAGVWTHVVFSWNKTLAELYQDGSFLASDATDATGIAYNYVVIGGDLDTGDPASYFNGTIDDVMIFNRALSPSEINQLYREPFCMFEPVFDYSLYGGIGDEEPPAPGTWDVVLLGGAKSAGKSAGKSSGKQD
jgi:hypothetical protein